MFYNGVGAEGTDWYATELHRERHLALNVQALRAQCDDHCFLIDRLEEAVA